VGGPFRAEHWGLVASAALIGGEHDPHVLAQMARARLRAKLAELEEAFYGSRFNDHHAFLGRDGCVPFGGGL
jgi:hypothetical protein